MPKELLSLSLTLQVVAVILHRTTYDPVVMDSLSDDGERCDLRELHPVDPVLVHHIV
jgi:hypothetical protein